MNNLSKTGILLKIFIICLKMFLILSLGFYYLLLNDECNVFFIPQTKVLGFKFIKIQFSLSGFKQPLIACKICFSDALGVGVLSVMFYSQKYWGCWVFQHHTPFLSGSGSDHLDRVYQDDQTLIHFATTFINYLIA